MAYIVGDKVVKINSRIVAVLVRSHMKFTFLFIPLHSLRRARCEGGWIFSIIFLCTSSINDLNASCMR